MFQINTNTIDVGKMLRQTIGAIDRTMLTARTAEGYSEVLEFSLLIVSHSRADNLQNSSHKLLNLSALFKICLHIFV